MSLVDRRGVSFSNTDQAALARLESAAELSHGYRGDPLAAADELVRAAPDFAGGHCLRAALAIMSTEKAARPLLADAVAAIERLGDRANARERAHGAAARAWLDGDFARAVRLYGDVLLDHPRDLLALQTAHVGDFLLGASEMLRDRVARVLPYWDAGVPGFGYVLGMYAFGLEETALYARAEETGGRALELERRDPWAVHAVVHVMEMQGRLREGTRWLTARADDWGPEGGLAVHLWWHLALYHLDLGETAQALAVYDARIHPRSTRIAYENVDASALLWRLALRGVDVGARWKALAADWEAAAEEGHYAFNDAHAVLAFAGAGDEAAAARTLAAMEQRLAGDGTNAGTNTMMTRDVGLPLARAVVAFSRGDYDSSVELLLGVRAAASRFGGSHAQRDIVHLTLTEAALRAGRARLGAALATERTEQKPRSPFNWLLAARAFELAGEGDAAARARRGAEDGRRAQEA